jgi:hypothetical protein
VLREVNFVLLTKKGIITLHYITLHYSTVHYITLHYILLQTHLSMPTLERPCEKLNVLVQLNSEGAIKLVRGGWKTI